MITIFDAISGFSIDEKNNKYKLLNDIGFHGVTLGWTSNFGDENFKLNPDLARKSGLFVENVHACFRGANNIWRDKIDGDTTAEKLITTVNECADLEVPTIVIHLTSGSTPPAKSDIGLKRLNNIIEIAEKRDIKLAFENLREHTNLDFVLSHFQSNHVGFCYDSGHNFFANPDIDFLKKYGNRLFALHLHDNDRVNDLHQIPFDGGIDWDNLMDKINQTGYPGATSLEILFDEYSNENIEDTLIKAYNSAKILNGMRK